MSIIFHIFTVKASQSATVLKYYHGKSLQQTFHYEALLIEMKQDILTLKALPLTLVVTEYSSHTHVHVCITN